MSEEKNPFYTTISVEGMTCNHCKATVEKNISALEGIDEVKVDLQTGNVTIGGNAVNLEKVAQRVNELGYEFKGKVS